MIASKTRGDSFRDLLAYILHPSHDPSLIATNMAGRDPGELAREFGDSLEQRRALGRADAERPVLHWSLSCAPEDRRLSAAELSVIAEEFVRRMGYEGCQYVAVEHNDRNHQHLHLVISRVRPDGSLIRDRLGDYHEAMRICRQLETEFGLRQVLPEQGQGLHQATRDEYREALRTDQPSERTQLQVLVQAAAAGRPTLTEFVRRLEENQVSVRLFRADDGPILGISYRMGRFPFRGSALGSSFTWPGLLRQVEYDPRRDRATIERISHREATPQRISGDRARAVIDRVLTQRPTLPAFVAALEAQGITVRLNVARTGHVSGISFGLDGRFIKGSELGRDYSWHSLARRGLRYEGARDGDLVRSFSGGGGDGGGDRPEPPALSNAHQRLVLDEARRLTPEYQRRLLEGAPDEALVRDRGEIQPSPGLAGRVAVERIRELTLARARRDFADEAPIPGLSLYPMAGYIHEDATPIPDHLTYVDGYASVWRDDQGQVVGAAYVDGCPWTIDVPAGLRQGFSDYSASVPSADRTAFMEWWADHQHLLEGGNVAAIAVDSALTRETTRRAVREIWMDLGRHRVSVRLPYETGRSTHLSLEGARSLNGQRADLVLSSAIAQAAVRNPDALLRLITMPDTGRPLTRAELLRGVMDVVDGGGRQFHVEGLAVKQAMRPLARDPEAFRRAFGFDLAVLPPQPILVLSALPEDRHELHFEDVFGRRLEEHNARVVEGQVGEGAAGVRGAAREGVSGPAASGAGETAGASSPGHNREDRPLAPPPRPQATDADRAELIRLIAQAKADRPTFTSFVARLQAAGVDARLYYLRERPVSLGFVVSSPTAGRVFVKARELGPEHSWKRLRGEVDFEPQRDAAAIAQVARQVKDRTRPHALEQARSILDQAAQGAPSLADFLRRAQDGGLQVRLYVRPEGEVFAVGYRLGRAVVRPRDLGPSYGWPALRERLGFDALRDAEIVQRVGRVIEAPTPRSNGEATGVKRRSRQASADEVGRVASLVRAARAGTPTFTEFVERLRTAGVDVRLYRLDGEPLALGYMARRPGVRWQGARIRARALGPGNGWRRVLREGLDFDAARDADTLARVAVELPHKPPQRLEPTADDRRRVREAVREAMTGGATLTQFVERVEARGVEVRLHRDPEGAVYSIGYGLPEAFIRGAELGPGQSWRRLLREGLSFDPERDATALHRVGETIQRRPDKGPDRPAPAPTPEQTEHVRRTVREALQGGATLSEFVERVEGAGIEVRLYRDGEGRAIAIGYYHDGVSLPGRELGPGHSWERLLRQGLTLDAERDARALHVTAVPLPEELAARERPTPAPEDLAAVREVLRTAATGRPTLAEFVERVESRGVEVRLYRDPDERVYAIGFGQGRLSINAHELGETFTWEGLRHRGVGYDPARDRSAVEQVGYTLAPDDSRARDALGTARDVVQIARQAKRRLDQVAELVEDPLSGLARIGGEAAMRAALQALSEGLRAAGREAAQRLAERQDEQLRQRDVQLLARAREGGDRPGPGPQTPPTPAAPTPDRPAGGQPPPTPSGNARLPQAAGAEPSVRDVLSPSASTDVHRRSIAHAAIPDAPERPSPGAPGPAPRGGSTLRSDDGPSRARNDARIGGERAAPGPGHRPLDRGPDAPAHAGAERPAPQGAVPDPGRASRGAPTAPGRQGLQRTPPADPARRDAAGREPGQQHERPDREGGRHAHGREAPALGRSGRIQAGGPARDPLVPQGAPGGAAPPGHRDRGPLDAPRAHPGFERPPSRDAADRTPGSPALTAARDARTVPADPAPRPETMTPLERFFAAAKALKDEIAQNRRASQERIRDLADSAVARHAPVVGAILQRVSTPGRVRELAETPEKALVAGAATVASTVLPAATPVVGAVERAVEKQIDLARSPDDDGRSR